MNFFVWRGGNSTSHTLPGVRSLSSPSRLSGCAAQHILMSGAITFHRLALRSVPPWVGSMDVAFFWNLTIADIAPHVCCRCFHVKGVEIRTDIVLSPADPADPVAATKITHACPPVLPVAREHADTYFSFVGDRYQTKTNPVRAAFPTGPIFEVALCLTAKTGKCGHKHIHRWLGTPGQGLLWNRWSRKAPRPHSSGTADPQRTFP